MISCTLELGSLDFAKLRSMSKTTESICRKTKIQLLFDSVAHRLDQGAIQHTIRTAMLIIGHEDENKKTALEGSNIEGKKGLGSFIISLIHRTLELSTSRHLPKGTGSIDLFSFQVKFQVHHAVSIVKSTCLCSSNPDPGAERYHPCRNFLYASSQSASIPSYLTRQSLL